MLLILAMLGFSVIVGAGAYALLTTMRNDDLNDEHDGGNN